MTASAFKRFMGTKKQYRLVMKATDDKREMKRAYAKKLRGHNPEDDPEGFMRLRAAYEQALHAAEFLFYDEPDWNWEDAGGADFAYDSHFDMSGAVEPLAQLKDGKDNSLLVIGQFEELYADFWRRVEVDEWKRIVDGMNLKEYSDFRDFAPAFFNSHNALPRAVMEYMDEEFEFSRVPWFMWPMLFHSEHDMCSSLAVLFDKNIDPGFDLAHYADLYVNAYLENHRGNYEYANELAKKALEIRGDYLVYEVIGDYHVSKSEKSEALDAYNKSIAFAYSKNLARTIADIQYELGMISKRKHKAKLKKLENKYSAAAGIFWPIMLILIGISAVFNAISDKSEPNTQRDFPVNAISVPPKRLILPTMPIPTVRVEPFDNPAENYEAALEAEESKNYHAAISYLKIAAEKGLPEAICRLGDYYYLGLGCVSSHATATEYYKQAVVLEYIPAYAKFVEMCIITENDEAGPEEFFSLLSTAIQNGDEPASLVLGRVYALGYGFEADFEKASIIFEGLADQGNVRAKANLGIVNLFRPVNPELSAHITETALRMTEAAAEADDFVGVQNLALFYWHGIGVDEDKLIAQELAKKAHELRQSEIHDFFGGIILYDVWICECADCADA